jgi:hypothetical protein
LFLWLYSITNKFRTNSNPCRFNSRKPPLYVTIFIRNVGYYKNYTASIYPRRQPSSGYFMFASAIKIAPAQRTAKWVSRRQHTSINHLGHSTPNSVTPANAVLVCIKDNCSCAVSGTCPVVTSGVITATLCIVTRPNCHHVKIELCPTVAINSLRPVIRIRVVPRSNLSPYSALHRIRTFALDRHSKYCHPTILRYTDCFANNIAQR